MSKRIRPRQIKCAILVVFGLAPWIFAPPVLTFENNEMWDLQSNYAIHGQPNGISSVSRTGVFNHLQEGVNSSTSFVEINDESVHLAEATGFSQDGINRMTSFDPRGTTLSPKCTNTSAYSRRGCWLAAEGRSDCWVWNSSPQPDETVSWDGHCVNGKLSGQGNVIWRFYQDGREMMSWQAGHYKDGREHGHFVYRITSGEIWEGNYEISEPHGLWIKRDTRQDLDLIAKCWQFGREKGLNTCIQKTNVPITRKLKSTVALRYGPGTEYRMTGNFLSTGVRVEVTHTNSGWVWIRAANGHAGFIPISLLTDIVSDRVSDAENDTWPESLSEEEMKIWIFKNLIDSL